MQINFKILLIGVSIPVIFSLLCQLGELMELIFPNVTIFVNMAIFATVLLVFLTSILFGYLYHSKMWDGIIIGISMGFLAETISLVFIILFSIIMQSVINQNSIDILTNDFIYYYIVPNLIFQSINGCIGGIIGVQISNYVN